MELGVSAQSGVLSPVMMMAEAAAGAATAAPGAAESEKAAERNPWTGTAKSREKLRSYLQAP